MVLIHRLFHSVTFVHFLCLLWLNLFLRWLMLKLHTMKFAFIFLLLAMVVLRLQGQEITREVLATINSAWDEQNPVLSPDGKTLFFTIANHPQNAGGKRDKGDIWFSEFTAQGWSAPVHGGNILNNAGYNAIGGISADGSTLYLLGHYAGRDQANTQGYSISRKTGSGWSAPENITIPYFLNRSATVSGYIHPHQNIFVFAGESYFTYGVEDIYITIRGADGTWSEPKNLGRNINTSFQELSPRLSEDTEYLYFASNGRQGYGSFDIYYARRLDDTWTRWTTPVNMGAGINSEGRELFYHPLPRQGVALFTTTLNSDGYGDIRLYRPPPEARDSLMATLPPALPDTVIKMMEIIREKPIEEAEKSVQISGKVTDAVSLKPVAANVVFQSFTSLHTQAGKDGTYSMAVPSVDEYNIRVEAPGYVGAFEKLDIRTFEMQSLEMNFSLQPVRVGATVNMKSVLFQQSTANLLDESFDELNMVVDFLKANPTVEIELSGHTDNRGIQSHNVRLSRERVDKVKEYLVNQGIEAKRITGKGYGGIKPIADNDAEITRRLNRRVEFTIIKN